MTDTAKPALDHVAWLWRGFLRRLWPGLALALIFMAIEGAAVGMLSYLIRPMFDQIRPNADRAVVIWIALSVAGVFVLRAVAGFSHRVIMARQAEAASADIQHSLLTHLMHLDLSFFQANPPGGLIERVRGDTQSLRQLLPLIFSTLGRDIVTLVALAAVALSIDWRWALIAVVGVPVILGPLALLQTRVRQTARAARAAATELSTRLDEVFHGIKTLQLTGSEDAEAHRYRAALTTYRRAQLRSEAASAAIPGLIDLVAASGFASVMFYGGLQIIAGVKTLGAFMSFFTAMALVFEPLRRLGSVSGNWAQARASLDRIRGLMDLRSALPRAAPPQPIATPPGGLGVTFDKVRFTYGDQTVLDDVSFTAEAGQTTALVGPSGAGKTTLFHLLTRLADPTQGRILLGGQDLRDLNLSDLRQQFSVVSQESALFDETIAANVRLGAADLSEAGLQQALHAANAAEFVDRLPLGAETSVGPRGQALSGGQRQRVAIARAVLRDAPILLLDEATSALDSQSEAQVTAALAGLEQGRTTLVIAHRLSTIRQAHKIIVMEAGRIVDQGSHDDLLARGGLYADLYHLQFKKTGG